MAGVDWHREEEVRGRGEATEVKAQGRKEGAAGAERGCVDRGAFPTLGALPQHPRRKGGLGHRLEARVALGTGWRPRCPEVCAEWPTEKPGALRGRPVS